MSAAAAHPSWDRLFSTASQQDGFFTTRQAAQAGYSPPLLDRHMKGGKIVRVRRGVYRLVHYPHSEHEDLVVIWLWSDRQGVFSHETALVLHELSGAMPGRMYLTLPVPWQSRRLRVPDGVVLAFAGVRKDQRTWVGPVPVTSVARTLLDCAAVHTAPDLLEQAVAQARERGLVSQRDADRALGRPESNP
jgi:predicted transcriptional regulator of viral defense system